MVALEENFKTYLEEIELPKPFWKNVEDYYKYYVELGFGPDKEKEPIKDVFITESTNNSTPREFENLWFFTPSYFMEVSDFQNYGSFDVTKIKEEVIRWEIETKDYDFKNVSSKSKMFLRVYLKSRLAADFKASGKNCERLCEIFKKYVRNNLV